MIDIKKQYKTRDGREVRIYATDGEDDYPVHGAVKPINGKWFPSLWTPSGRACNPIIDSKLDLIEVKPRIKREVWVNVYDIGCSTYTTKEMANLCASSTRLACVKIIIDCEEGDGL
jgi:hypothetical protein